ncbi:MAG: FecR family protein, partial [Bdellovibrionota bacterium]
MLRIFLLSLWISAFCLYPHTSYSKAEVVFLKGNAVVIDPKGTKTLLRQGHVFESDGLIATDKKSLMRLKLDDGSVLSLGPESKMTLAQVLPGKPKVIELLAGKLRATINEKTPVPSEGHKMYIKTRTAALGVRGTDFLVVHNPKNHVTSTVTFKGDVNLFKKRDEDVHESLREELNRKGQTPKIDQEKDLVNLEDDLRHHTATGVA